MTDEITKDTRTIDCIGLLDLFFAKNPDEDKDLFRSNEEALTGFIQSLLENPAVETHFPEVVNLLFTDKSYAENISKLKLEDLKIVNNDEMGWVLIEIKRK